MKEDTLTDNWTVAIADKVGCAQLRDIHGHRIAIVDCPSLSTAENIDNALLMASSPLLLEACKLALSYIKYPSADKTVLVTATLEQAIKKSYGLDSIRNNH